MFPDREEVNQFICELEKKFNRHPSRCKNLIFRGEPEYYREVQSSLLRRIEDSVKEVSSAADKNIAKVFNSDESNRIIAREASSYFGGDIMEGREFEAIATLQHYGAPTPLIDFSLDWRIALYFACEKLKYCYGGRIIFFSSKRAKDRYGLSVRNPSGHHHDNAGQTAGRQIDQQSVLVWSENGEFKPDTCDIKTIPWKYKPALLAWLRSEGIHRESVYRDVHGYVGLINEAWPLVHAAKMLIERGKLELAERILKTLIRGNKNVEGIEQKGKIFFLLGQAVEKQKKQDSYKNALEHYESACNLLLHRSKGTEPRLAAARCLRKLNKKDCADAVIADIDNLWK